MSLKVKRFLYGNVPELKYLNSQLFIDLLFIVNFILQNKHLIHVLCEMQCGYFTPPSSLSVVEGCLRQVKETTSAGRKRVSLHV